MRFATLSLLLVVLCGCATVKVKRTIRDTNGKKIGYVIVHKATNIDGVAVILDGVRRYEESATGHDLGQQAIGQGQAVSLSTAGATFGSSGRNGIVPYNAYGLYGPYGYNPYGRGGLLSPYNRLAAIEQLTFSHNPGPVRLPPLRQATAPPPQMLMPATQQSLPALTGDGREPCPTKRDPITQGERLSCSEIIYNHLMSLPQNQ